MKCYEYKDNYYFEFDKEYAGYPKPDNTPIPVEYMAYFEGRKEVDPITAIKSRMDSKGSTDLSIRTKDADRQE